MRYLLLNDEQIKVAKTLQNKGFLILIDVLESMRDGRQISERGLAKKYEISHKVMRKFMVKVKKGHSEGTEGAHEGHTERNRINELSLHKGTEGAHEGHTEGTNELIVAEAKQIALPAKPKSRVVKPKRERDLDLVVLDNETAQDAHELFQHWKKRMNHPRAAFTQKQYSYIKPVLDNPEYGLEGALRAVEGCAKSEWHMGGNPEGRFYDSLELILRPDKINNFIKLVDTNAKDRRPTGKTDHKRTGTDVMLDRVIEHRKRQAAGLEPADHWNWEYKKSQQD